MADNNTVDQTIMIESSIKMLKEIKESGEDQEVNHIEADSILCAFIIGLGFPEVVAAWDDIEKWYA